MDLGVVRRDGRTDPFFDGAAADRLMIRRCAACDRWYRPDASGCPGCGTEDLEWAQADGTATLVSWAKVHGRPDAAGVTPPPAVLALVELAEGPWMYSRVEGVERPRMGLALRAEFHHPAEGESVLLFRPT